mgnify:CR=1 FL=1
MGRSDPIIYKFYNHYIRPTGKVALLGFDNNEMFDGDLYDLQLGNWEINSDWSLPMKYDTIISLRCPYFAKDPHGFIQKCYEHLNDNGRLFVDWGIGDHWRFENYKVGWTKDGEHEYAYADDNYLWSFLWDDSFQQDNAYRIFEERVGKFGYDNVKKAIYDEVPSVIELDSIRQYFKVAYRTTTLWEDLPQLYVLLCGLKGGIGR